MMSAGGETEKEDPRSGRNDNIREGASLHDPLRLGLIRPALCCKQHGVGIQPRWAPDEKTLADGIRKPLPPMALDARPALVCKSPAAGSPGVRRTPPGWGPWQPKLANPARSQKPWDSQV